MKWPVGIWLTELTTDERKALAVRAHQTFEVISARLQGRGTTRDRNMLYAAVRHLLTPYLSADILWLGPMN